MGDELLTRAEVAASGAAIASVQEPDGAVPWTVGGHTDVWNHVEAAMALLVAGRLEAVDRAWAWVRATQRSDGTCCFARAAFECSPWAEPQGAGGPLTARAGRTSGRQPAAANAPLPSGRVPNVASH